MKLALTDRFIKTVEAPKTGRTEYELVQALVLLLHCIGYSCLMNHVVRFYPVLITDNAVSNFGYYLG
ncbi:MAG: hypothetical protein WC748_08720 [Legionellales bacterium]|jgi:hypothetical protein